MVGSGTGLVSPSGGVLCAPLSLPPFPLIFSLTLHPPQAPYTKADVVWEAADFVYHNLMARGNLSPHLPPDAGAAAVGAVRAAAAAAVPGAVVPLEQELRLR